MRIAILCVFAALLWGCKKTPDLFIGSPPHMKKRVDFGIPDYLEAKKTLVPEEVAYPETALISEKQARRQMSKFLKNFDLSSENESSIKQVVPDNSLYCTHGPLMGVSTFIEWNSNFGVNVLRAGFLIFATGPNGDYVVVDMLNGSGETGWLPMAMVGSMSTAEIRSHFIPVAKSLGDFLLSSENGDPKLGIDWYSSNDALKSKKSEQGAAPETDRSGESKT
ncbi:hypothetical protein [Roseibacillus persicicus]|uniref:hypothetical protein n=1 Tax=Roseibacillus persicicus TaxID=454148 RepID=UPI00280D8664|nr:hypothetical protein [Roseibacillus persicicus]MDQ8192705.1 hypothetical protein [Roseibacillus persicicus]